MLYMPVSELDRNRETVGAERMRLSQDKSRSRMIMPGRESWAYPNRQYGFPACSLLSVTSNTNTRTHTHRSLTKCCATVKLKSSFQNFFQYLYTAIVFNKHLLLVFHFYKTIQQDNLHLSCIFRSHFE